MMYGDKEEIYDDQINPLMNQIIQICKENGINMVASFQLRSEEEDDNGNFLCTTLLPVNEDHYPDSYRNLCRSIYEKPKVLAMTIMER